MKLLSPLPSIAHFAEQLEVAKQRGDARAMGQLKGFIEELTRMKLAFEADLTDLGEEREREV